MRDRGTGSVSIRKDGRYQGLISLGVDDQGRPRRKAVYGQTRAEVTRKMRVLRQEYEDGGVISTDRRVTVAQFAETWISVTLESRVVAGSLRRSTAEWYGAMVRHTVEVIGKKRLDAVTPSDIERVILSLEDLAPSSRRGVFVAASKMFDAARRDGLVPRNPCSAIDRPQPQPSEARHLTMAEVSALIGEADGAMKPAIILLALTAIRRGELLALAWGDLDLVGGSARVEFSMTRTQADGLARTPVKSRRSRRTVPLPLPAIQALKEHRDALVAAPMPSAPVFPSSSGTWQEPRNFSRRFAAVAASAGVDAGVHTMRHTGASEMILAGIPLPVVSQVLGHADVKITADTYVHIVEAQRRAATDALGDALTKATDVRTDVGRPQ